MLLAASVSLTPEQRSLRASLAASAMHAKNDPHKITAGARAGFLKRFLDQVDAAAPGLPEAERQRRANHLLQAHMKRLALASSKARAQRKAAPDG